MVTWSDQSSSKIPKSALNVYRCAQARIWNTSSSFCSGGNYIKKHMYSRHSWRGNRQFMNIFLIQIFCPLSRTNRDEINEFYSVCIPETTLCSVTKDIHEFNWPSFLQIHSDQIWSLYACTFKHCIFSSQIKQDSIWRLSSSSSGSNLWIFFFVLRTQSDAVAEFQSPYYLNCPILLICFGFNAWSVIFLSPQHMQCTGMASILLGLCSHSLNL